MEVIVSNFGCLPIEILSEIFTSLTFREKKKARLVCHQWRLALDNSNKFFTFRLIVTNRSAQFFFNTYQHNVDQIIMKNLTKQMPQMTATHNIFPRIKNAILGWKNSQGKIVNFLKHGCTYSESLEITKFSMEKIHRKVISEILLDIKWTYLKQLKINVVLTRYKSDRAIKHCENTATFLKFAKIPNLFSFEFHFVYNYKKCKDQEVGYRKLYLEFLTFLNSHGKSLKILSFTMGNDSRQSFCFPKIPKDFSNLMKLEICSFRFWRIRKLENLVCPILVGSMLKILGLNMSDKNATDIRLEHEQINNSLELNNNIAKIFEANAETLEVLLLDMSIIDLNWLKPCFALQKVKLVAGKEIWANPNLILPITNLKIFQLYGADSFPPTITDLICKNQNTLEALGLSTIASIFEGPSRLWLKDFSRLTNLSLVTGDTYNMALRNPEAKFPELIQLDTIFHNVNDQSNATWITQSMPNLEAIKIFEPYTTLPILQTLLQIRKLKSITFFSHGALSEDIVKFCYETPGLRLRIGSKLNISGQLRHDMIVNPNILIHYEFGILEF